MDEPLSNLDAKLRVSMRASLNQLHDRLGVTTVYVTHDQVEAMTLGHRVCVLHDGRLQQVDTPQTLFESPVNLFVAGFIGSPAMNFVTAELVRDDGAAVTFAGYKLRVPPEVLETKPGLADYFGKKVILGIRPSDFEDASLGQDGRGTMRVTAGVTEELGSEINVIFTIDAPHVEHASIAEAAEAGQDEDEATAALAGGQVAVDGAGVQGEPGPARGAAGRRHPLPAVLRPRQRPVDRPPPGHGPPGGVVGLAPG
jgi:multiple sugar transport system ATP-binding protein